MSSENPYQAPTSSGSIATAIELEPDKPVQVGKVFLKWLVICVISAAPSFFWGFLIGQQTISSVVGMLAGILTFVVGYATIECRPFAQRWLRNRLIRRTAKIGYGTRLGMSIIFPVGMYLDMITGMIAIATTQGFDDNGMGNEQMPLLWFYLTTIVQGIYLNIVLFVYMLVAYAFVRLFSKPETVQFTGMAKTIGTQND